jgi:ribonuclease VapC
VIVDSSALIAILRNEPDAQTFAAKIESARSCRISAATYVETATVIDSVRDPVVSRRFDELIEEAGLIVEPVREAQAKSRAQPIGTSARAAAIRHN